METEGSPMPVTAAKIPAKILHIQTGFYMIFIDSFHGSLFFFHGLFIGDI